MDGSAGIFLIFVPLAVIDLPFSMVADTLFLPYTVFHTESVLVLIRLNYC
nr:YceK/YidQ family lipoprotein [Pseudomonas sp. B329]